MNSLSSTKILVVDDNIGARRSIEGLLAAEGYTLVLTESGAEALEIAKTEHPDLILLDVMMPGINGYEVCDAIRKHPYLSEIPIIMITALDDDESLIKGIDAGADDFLSKPINKLELRSRVRGICRLNRYRKLWSERQKFEWVVQKSRVGFVSLDAENRIAFVNPKAIDILDAHQNHPLVGSDFFDTIHEANYLCRPNNAQDLMLSGSSLEDLTLVRAQTSERSTRWIRSTFLNLSASGPERLLVRLEDITTQMISFQEKHTFSRMISHKLLTPLHAIKAAQQLFECADIAKLSPEIERLNGFQRKGIERLEYDIESILRFLESNNTANRGTATPLRALIQSAAQVGEDLGLAFALDSKIRDTDNRNVNISSYHFETCMRELMENSVKFHPQGTPQVRVSARASTTENAIVFEIENDGASMSTEEIENAWTPYWQADRYSTGEVKGMGLGLSLVATNVWAAGGTCLIKNRSGTQGVSVTITLPISA